MGFFLYQSKLPFPKWSLGFSWGVCSCTSYLFGIPHLSSLCLPCFRPCAWLTCPSSSELLNTTPPWNHQLQSSDLPGPVCFSMKPPPGSALSTFAECIYNAELWCLCHPRMCHAGIATHGILWSAGSWSRKGRLPRHCAVSPLLPLQGSPPRVHVIPRSIWSPPSSCASRRRWCDAFSAFWYSHIWQVRLWGGMGWRVDGQAHLGTLVGRVHCPCSASGQW